MNQNYPSEACPACRLRGLAGFLYAVVGANKVPPEEAPGGHHWPRICMSCGYQDDGNRIPQSPHHCPHPVPACVMEGKANG